MGMHPGFEQEDSFILADILLNPERMDVLNQLIGRNLVSGENVQAWVSFLSDLKIDSTPWFKALDYLKVKIDPLITGGGYISEKAPVDIVNNFKIGASVFDSNFFSHANFRGKTALDFGSGVYRPLCVALILYANGFDRVYSFEPFALKDRFPYASLMQMMNEMLVRPSKFDFSGIGENELVERVRSLDLRNIDTLLGKLGKGEIDHLDLSGVLFTNNIDHIPSGKVDVHFSNAVLEHVRDLSQVSYILNRVTTTDSVGYHVVDYLDHRYYDDTTLSPFEKYYDGVLDEINGLTPSELEGILLGNEWTLRKLTFCVVPEVQFAREKRAIIGRYAKYSAEELSEHVNCYEFRKAVQA